MFNEPRNWKWAVPMMLIAPFGLTTYWLGIMDKPWLSYLACIPGMITLVMAVLTVSNFIRYQVEWRTDVFDQRQRALNITPVTMLADALRGMHPEAARILNKFGVKTSWQIKIDMENGSRDWILLGTNVHFGFIEMILDKSNHGLYPKRMLSEGSKRWDPDGLVSDYDQYDEFQSWLMGRLIVTRPFGSQPSMFIPPWTPKLLKETMGLSGDELELYKPEDENFTNGKNGKKNVVSDKLDDLIPLKKE